MQETNREHRKQQECKEINSEVSAVVQNRACMEIHHEFRAASKEPEALQQLNFFSSECGRFSSKARSFVNAKTNY